MAELVFLDFDLSIETAGNGYRARVLDSPAGQAATYFEFPVDDWALQAFLVSLGTVRQRARRVESGAMRAAKQLGGSLFDAVFSSEVRTCWQRCLDEARRRNYGLRIRLRLGSVPELAELPWEFLYDSTTNQFLALSTRTPLVRYMDLPQSIFPLAIKPPLRVLVMISNPVDWDELDVVQERRKLEYALQHLIKRGLVILEFLQDATLETLQRRLRQNAFHLFHFIGHGGFDENQRDGLLVLCDENGRGRRVTSQRLGTLLADHSSLRLVILNACEGARSAREDQFTGVAQTLMQKGIPAIIGMQFDVSDQVAISFSQEFYAAFVDGYPVDAAVNEARKTVYGQGNDVAWGIPVLYMRAPDGRIFDFDAPAASPPRARSARSLVLALVILVTLMFIVLTQRMPIQGPSELGAAPLLVTPPPLRPSLTASAAMVHPTATLPAPTARLATGAALPTLTRASRQTTLPVLLPTQSRTPTHSPTATVTPTRRFNPAAPTFAPTLPPGVFVTQLTIDPPEPLRDQEIYFSATLVNTFDTPQLYRLRFQIYDGVTRQRYTDTAIQTLNLTVGDNPITALPWTYRAPLLGCRLLYVQVEYQTNAARIPFRDGAGNVLARDFVVCAPER